MKTSRLASTVTAILLLAAALATAAVAARRLESDAILALAPQMFAQKHRGIALQRAAFQQPDLLPLYGSSELNLPGRYHASALFRDHPTGFTVFPVGDVGSTSLVWAQALAAIGPDLRGRKVAVSLPSRSFLSEAIDRHAYAANFSHLHARALAFSPHLSFAVKQAAARRMLEYPATLSDDRLLTFALERLADGSFSSRLLYYTSLPLGMLHNIVLRLQDHWETGVFLRAQLGLTTGQRRDAELDWAALARQAEHDTHLASEGNAFGFENSFWARHAWDVARQRGMYPDGAALRSIERSAEWGDVDLLLRVIKELGGQPLLLSTPFNQPYADHIGVDAGARRAHQQRLDALAAAHGVALVDFAATGASDGFTINPTQHLSGTGWIAYGRALDEFVQRGDLSTRRRGEAEGDT